MPTGAVQGEVASASVPPPYRVARSLLPNGLRLVTVEAPHLHTATVCLYVRAGSRYETPATSGLSHFVEHMLFRGSAGYPDSLALNRAIEHLGGTLYAETGRDYSLYQVSLAPGEVAAGLAILGDLFRSPAFRDIDLERKIILEEILEDLDDRGRNVNVDDVSRAAVWRAHPLGMPITGPLANVRRFGAGDVRRHFKRFYGARNLVLCVAGPVGHPAVRRWAVSAFRGVPAGRRARAEPANGQDGGPIWKCVANEAAQTQVQVVFRALPDRDPDYMALAALLRVVDDGMSTRLHYRICDQKGLAYHVAASLEPLYDATLLEVDAACAHAKLPALVGEALAILAELREIRVSDEELGKAKRRYRGDLEASYDDLDGLAGWFGGTELFYRPRTHEQRARMMERVTAADIRRVARRVVRPERLTVAAVGSLSPTVRKRVEKIVRGFR